MSGLREIRSDYWRNRDGSIVHTNDCIYSGSKGATTWPYADGMSPSDVRTQVAFTPWLSLCKRCWTDDE